VTARGTWERALDAFAARVTAAERTLEESGDAEPVTWEPPGPLPTPFPPELLVRAETLLARAAAVEEALAIRRGEVRAELVRIPRLAPVRQASAAESRFDVRG
jgi:hypothetical protein